MPDVMIQTASRRCREDVSTIVYSRLHLGLCARVVPMLSGAVSSRVTTATGRAFNQYGSEGPTQAPWERTCDFIDFLPGLGDFSEGCDDNGHLCQQDVAPELVETDDGGNDWWIGWGNRVCETSEDDDWEFGAEDDYDDGWSEMPQWPDDETVAPDVTKDNEAPPCFAPVPREEGNIDAGDTQVDAPVVHPTVLPSFITATCTGTT